MSTLNVSEIRNAATTAGGITIDSSGAVSGGLPTPNRNLLYNGAMQVAQRGTSVTGSTTGAFVADRFSTAVVSQGTWTLDIQNDAPTGSGFRKSSRVLCTTADAAPAASDLVIFSQLLEGQDLQRIAKGTASAQKLTLSFWVKSNVTGTYIADLVDADNTRHVSASYTISASATWEKKTITFPADTTGAFDNDNALSLRVRWWLGAGSDYTSGTLATTWASTTSANMAVGQTNLAAATNNYWQITGVQLEVGDTATEFEHLPYGVELARCQRYYQRITSDGGNREIAMGYTFSSTGGTNLLHFPVAMRTEPTALETTGTAANYLIIYDTSQAAFTSVPTFTSATNLTMRIQFTGASGPTIGRGCILRFSAAGVYLGWSAEL